MPSVRVERSAAGQKFVALKASRHCLRAERRASMCDRSGSGASITTRTFASSLIPFSRRLRRRTRDVSNTDSRLKAGGKPRYLLSGLLRCGECDAHYILAGAAAHSCSGYLGGERDRIIYHSWHLFLLHNEIFSGFRNHPRFEALIERVTEEMRRQRESLNASPQAQTTMKKAR